MVHPSVNYTSRKKPLTRFPPLIRYRAAARSSPVLSSSPTLKMAVDKRRPDDDRRREKSTTVARGWRTRRGTEGGRVEREKIELSVRTPASTEKAAGVGWMDFQPRIDNNCLNQARLSRPPRRRGVERRRAGEGAA